MTNATITIAKSLDLAEINTANGFSQTCVIDTRTKNGHARPIEECVLRRLKNHFVDYAQMPIEFGKTGPCVEVDLCETLSATRIETLVLADDLTQLSALLDIYKLEFRSNDLYIVETGKGDELRRSRNTTVRQQPQEDARFGTFGH